MSTAQPSWHAELEADARRMERLPAAKNSVLAALKSTRAAIVTIEYDAEGDSGQIESITAQSAAGRSVKLQGKVTLDLHGQPREYASLEEALDDFAWLVLRVYHAGFENNEGGYGTLTIDVRKSKVILDHNDRIIEVSSTLTEV